MSLLTIILAPMPVLLAMGLLAARRSSIEAGLAGAALGAGLALAGGLPGAVLADAALRSLWIAWMAVSVILAGLVFDAVASPVRGSAWTDAAATTAGPDDRRYRRIFTACMLIGPFAESATGFGVGAVVTAALLRGEGLGGARAAVLALLSQLLVPWGALAIGTQVTAVLMRHDPHQLGAAAAAVSAIAYAGGLVVLRLQLAAVGIRPRRRDRLIDPPLVAGLIVALVVANLFLGPETAALAALGLPIAIDLGVRRRDVAIRTTTRILAPYLALTLVLLVTRLVTPLAEALRHWIWQPVDGLPGYAPLHHPAGWLLATAVVAALMAGNRPGRIGHDIARGLGHGIRPAAATIAFVLLAGVWAAGGAPTVLAAAWRDVAAGADLAIIPPLAGLAGFLTGSNVAVAAMIAPLADALPGMGADGGGAGALMALLIAAMLLVVGGLATMVSPMRLAMAAALTGAAASDEAAIRRRSTPLPVAVALLLGLAAAVAGLLG
ncbi:hypothetical protein GCM10011505_21080 [Tistrella bauzanensis]|uniref:L-lactate permease n=2 Tax=Tistrella bauzanensis TaxID=657419 RepID=A0ABQ1IFU4_9PROT|nr:hypothetical protein GCM10011505_21080 [Tistrella bauzanensis]